MKSNMLQSALDAMSDQFSSHDFVNKLRVLGFSEKSIHGGTHLNFLNKSTQVQKIDGSKKLWVKSKAAHQVPITSEEKPRLIDLLPESEIINVLRKRGKYEIYKEVAPNVYSKL